MKKHNRLSAMILAYAAVFAVFTLWACELQEPGNPSAGSIMTFTAGNQSWKMAYVPGGHTFPRGTGDDETAIVANSFLIAETEVTYQLWNAVRLWASSSARGSNIYYFANDGAQGSGTATDQHPVTTINWRDAIVWCNALTEYCNYQNGTNLVPVYFHVNGTIRDSRDANSNICDNAGIKPTGTGFRLPSTEEWEFAARWRNNSSNTVPGYSNPWFTRGNSASGAITFYNDAEDLYPANGIPDGQDTNHGLGVYGDYWDGDSWVATTTMGTAVVKSKGINGANSLGLYDMAGNVNEWCFDKYSQAASQRILHGGNWDYTAFYLQTGVEMTSFPENEYNHYGLRIAMSQ
ncbi:MAG: SUMF1/EgtB/PvdO family nonheme iron enzyme [Spirochaetales bacterium]|nr:SUMF1/EgtB/PvdO family nonheme iron enzyme [Spirochaetales bacterium]